MESERCRARTGRDFSSCRWSSCPIALYPATTAAEKTHFHQINKRTGNRLRQQMVDSETGRVVDKDNKGRGYEVSKGRYVEIEEDELDAVELESTHTIDIDEFVPTRRDRRALSRPALLHRARPASPAPTRSP